MTTASGNRSPMLPLMNFINDKLAPVMASINEVKTIKCIMGGITGAMPATLLGSLFLIFMIFAGMLNIPSISPALFAGYSLTIGMMGFYVAISVGITYANMYNLNQGTAAVISSAAFFTILFTADENMSLGSLPGNMGANSIFPALIVTLLAMRLYRLTIEKKWIIKMPAGVPPMIGEMFSAMIPSIIIILITWSIRSLLNFDIATWMTTALAPIFRGADNVFTISLRMLVSTLLWSVGLHGEAMVSTIFLPFWTTWATANADAAVAQQPLPYIWTLNFDRVVLWVPSVWSLMFWMYISKIKAWKTLAIAATPAALFTIVEPIIFGLPIAFNAYLLIPFVTSTLLTTIICYLLTSANVFARFYVGLPAILPPPLLAVLDAGGAWQNIFIVVIGLAIGILLYWPFVKAYEKVELAKEVAEEKQPELEAVAMQ